MVSIEKISRKLIQLDEYLGILEEIAKVPENAFLKDKILIGSAKNIIYRSVLNAAWTWPIISSLRNDTERPGIMQILLPCWRKKGFFSRSLDII